jgi:hypothetical protein
MGSILMSLRDRTKKGKSGKYYQVLDTTTILLKPKLTPSKKPKSLDSPELLHPQTHSEDTALTFLEHVPPAPKTLPPYGKLVQEDLASIGKTGEELCPYVRNCSRNRISGEIYDGTCALINGKCSGEYATHPIGKSTCPEYQKFWNPRKENVEKIIALYSS